MCPKTYLKIYSKTYFIRNGRNVFIWIIWITSELSFETFIILISTTKNISFLSFDGVRLIKMLFHTDTLNLLGDDFSSIKIKLKKKHEQISQEQVFTKIKNTDKNCFYRIKRWRGLFFLFLQMRFQVFQS